MRPKSSTASVIATPMICAFGARLKPCGLKDRGWRDVRQPHLAVELVFLQRIREYESSTTSSAQMVSAEGLRRA